MATDKTLVCKDCGKEFTFTEGEQEFYADKGFSDPIRCADCRQAKKDSKRNGKKNSGEEQSA